jgi:flagellar basal-body rod modification protein FlgD
MIMTTINTAGSNASTPDDTATKQRQVGKKELTKDDFMKIFLQQIRMQDPNKPYDSSAMLQQMAQLTALSASEELQSSIRSLNTSIAKSQVMSASQLIGKKVQLLSAVAPLVEKEGLSGSVVLESPVTDVTITIKDKDGNVVKTITKGASGRGVVDFSWDGKDPNDPEKEMKADFYNISAVATINGKPQSVLTAGTFKVGSVSMNTEDGTVFLNVDGLGGVGMGSIIKVL